MSDHRVRSDRPRSESDDASIQSSGGSESASASAVVNQTMQGIVYFSWGQGLLLVAGLLGNIVLARELSPADFGIYAIVNLFVLKLNWLAGLGLPVKLIHDQEPPSLTSQRSIFTLHCAVSVVLYAALFAAAPWLAMVCHLDSGGVTFFRILGLVILTSPLSTIPGVMLNRALSYGQLSLIGIAEGLTFQFVAVVCAVAGFGYWSFGIAALISAGSRLVLSNSLSPWRVGFAWDRDYLRHSLRFGGAFQLADLTHIPRDNIITFLGGPLFGPVAVGLLSWAIRLAEICGQTFVQACAAVSFASWSRMKSDAALFARSVSQMLRYVNLATCFTLSVAAALAPEMIHVVFTDKWAPAVPLFYLFAIRMVAANYAWLFDLAVRASGAPHRSLKILSMWTVCEWGVAAIAAVLFGYAGIAIASALTIWFAVAWLSHEVSKRVAIDLWYVSVTPLWCGIVTFACLYLGKAEYIQDVATLGGAILLAVPVYVAAGLAAEGRAFWTEIRAGLSRLGTSLKVRMPAPAAAGE